MMKKLHKLVLIIGLLFSGFASAQTPFIGEIKMFAGNFAPQGYAFCDGQLLPIAQNTALFSLIGTIYGGDGQTTFALPDLRGRAPIHKGQGAGLSNKQIGSRGGSETNTITVAQMPSHNHTVNAVSTNGDSTVPTNNLPANTNFFDNEYSTGATDVTMKSTMLGNTGNGQAVNNMQPYTTINYIIALTGMYPSPN